MSSAGNETPDNGIDNLNTDGNNTLAGAAYDRLKADVTGGIFEPGQRLRIDELRKALGTGASPLREALSRLAAEGIVLSVGQRGFRVPPVSIEELRDITSTRIIVETEALRQSIEHGDDEWEVGVVASFHRLTKVETGGRPEFREWDRCNKAFHDALLAACPSRWLLRLCGTMYDQHRRYRAIVLQTATARRDVHGEHENIKNAALARDAARACAEAEEHIRRTAEIDEQVIREQMPSWRASGAG